MQLLVTRSVTSQVRSERGTDGWARERPDTSPNSRARGREDRGFADPIAALRQSLERHVGFCLEYPAFLDCSLSLMQPPAGELRERVSGAVWSRLGRAMAVCRERLERILAAGAEREVSAIGDPDFTANRIYAQVLGSMHLARAGVGVRGARVRCGRDFSLDPETVCEACTEDTLTLARISDPVPSASA